MNKHIKFMFDDSLPSATTFFELSQKRGHYLDKRVRRRLIESQTDGNVVPVSKLAPLYQGFGVHYAYIWVGTPPQRVSVIVDTGSHHTAFPCTGCKCGKHYDPYWDPSKSSTSKIQKCNGKQCMFSQSYTEGSSWKAFKVKDYIWLGGISVDMLQGYEKWNFEFSFGCQESETGLFRTQNVDGIMGMSASEDTFPQQLFLKKITSTKVFALCFSVGNGILAIGGVDQSIHLSPILYARTTKLSGWYTIKIIDISMIEKSTNNSLKLEVQYSKLNEGKGAIVDSGTTDTYLPSSIKGAFHSMFKKITGINYSNSNMHLNKQQVASIPDIKFRFEDANNQPIEVIMPASSYLDVVSKGKYAFRIYLTENQGAVLGANFMNGRNVIFDIDGRRVGFADSTCKFDNSMIALNNNASLPPINNHINYNSNSSSSSSSSSSSEVGKNVLISKGLETTTERERLGSSNSASSSKPITNPFRRSNVKMSSSLLKLRKQNMKTTIQTIRISQITDIPCYTDYEKGYANNNNNNNNHKPLEACSATCHMNMTTTTTTTTIDNRKYTNGFIVTGNQTWLHICNNNTSSSSSSSSSSSPSLVATTTATAAVVAVAVGNDLLLSKPQSNHYYSNQPCTVSCSNELTVVQGNPDCPTSPWSECDIDCTQFRHVAVTSTTTATTTTTEKCHLRKESRFCHIHTCRTESTDRVVALELRLKRLTYQQWSFTRREDILRVLAKLLFLSEGSMRMVGEPVYRPPWLKLHIRIRFRYVNLLDLVTARIVTRNTTILNQLKSYVLSTPTTTIGESTQSIAVDYLVNYLSDYISNTNGVGSGSDSDSSDSSFMKDMYDLLVSQGSITVSDWKWLRQDDLYLFSTTILPSSRQSQGQGMALAKKESAHKDLYQSIKYGDQLMRNDENRSKWAIGITITVFIFAISLFCCLLRKKVNRPLRSSNAQEVLKLHRLLTVQSNSDS